MFDDYLHFFPILFQAPQSFELVDVLDLFYKVHKVFELPFNTQIKHMMYFLDCFVYQNDFPEEQITSAMRLVAHDLLKIPLH